MANWIKKLLGLEDFEESEEYKKEEQTHWHDLEEKLENYNDQMQEYLDGIDEKKKSQKSNNSNNNESDLYNEMIDFDDIEIQEEDSEPAGEFDNNFNEEASLDNYNENVEEEQELLCKEELLENIERAKREIHELKFQYKKAHSDKQREEIVSKIKALGDQLSLFK